MGEKETGSAAEAERFKTKTKSNQSNDRMAGEDGGDLDDDGAAVDVSERATWTSSNPGIARTSSALKTRDADQGFREGGITHEDDWHTDAAKVAPERPVKSEIAIGDPGVNGNLAMPDAGVTPAAQKKPS